MAVLIGGFMMSCRELIVERRTEKDVVGTRRGVFDFSAAFSDRLRVRGEATTDLQQLRYLIVATRRFFVASR